MNRLDNNKELLNRLEYLINRHPDMRFSQILDNFGFVKAERPVKDPGRIHWQNEFYVEPGDLLIRVNRRIEDIEYQDGLITPKQATDLLNIPLEKDESPAGRLAMIQEMLDPSYEEDEE